MNSGGSPEGIIFAHGVDEITNILGNPGCPLSKVLPADLRYFLTLFQETLKRPARHSGSAKASNLVSSRTLDKGRFLLG
jgi:hypothetical protein